jgi:hypothetical protein
MNFIYTTKEGIFETNDWTTIPLSNLHSFNDEPSFEDLKNGYKEWKFEGNWHRESGPAVIYSDGSYFFYLNDIYYENVKDWLKDNPNQDKAFQVMMILQYS